jgi:hypothetical protein
MTYYEADMYPVQLDVEYPEEPRNRLTTFFRLILMIPIVIMAILVSWSAGLLSLATLLMILFRKKYPRWWFDFNLELLRFSTRVNAYVLLLRDEYPSTDDDQAVSLEISYPDAESQLNRFMPLIKWFLAIPHYVVIYVLSICALVVMVIAWFAILIVGRYPPGLFNFSVGVMRWETRVNAYMVLLTTDRYPPFRLGA